MKICGRTWYAVHGEVVPERYYSYESKMVCFPALGYCAVREECAAPSGYEDRAKTEEPVRGVRVRARLFDNGIVFQRLL
jgi:hypothetical protein